MVFYRWMIPSWWVNLFTALTNIILFIGITETFIHYLAIPKLFLRQKYYLFFGATILCLFLNGVITLILTWLIILPFSNSYFLAIFWSWENLLYGNFFVVTAFTAISLVIKLMFDWFNIQLAIQKMEKEKINAELQSLKAQLNPHFLFNSLNMIYGEIDKRNSDARLLLVEFADLLRYQIYDCNADFIPLEKEIEYLNSYIEIQKRRKNKEAKIEFNLAGFPSGYKIAPLLFTPFVENAFKYLSNFDEEENYISISLDINNDCLNFKCINSLDSIVNYPKEMEKKGGIGIENLRKRLELIYPEKHKLLCFENKKKFEIEMEINLKN